MFYIRKTMPDADFVAVEGTFTAICKINKKMEKDTRKVQRFSRDRVFLVSFYFIRKSILWNKSFCVGCVLA